MYSHYKNFFLSDPIFLSYFVPQRLEKEKIFPVRLRSLEKNDIKLESLNYNIVDLQQNFLLSLENRFWLYNERPFFGNQEFTLCFKGIDFSSKSLLYSKRKKKLSGSLSFFYRVKENEFLFTEARSEILVKSRLLRLTKGGFASSCLGNPAFIIRSSSFYKFRKYDSYKGWFSLNLLYYGLLSYFSLLRFEKKVVAFPKSCLNKHVYRKAQFYYIKNNNLKYFFLLGKPKISQLV